MEETSNNSKTYWSLQNLIKTRYQIKTKGENDAQLLVSTYYRLMRSIAVNNFYNAYPVTVYIITFYCEERKEETLGTPEGDYKVWKGE